MIFVPNTEGSENAGADHDAIFLTQTNLVAAIGRQINVSRERVRQLESKALSNLKLMTGHVLISRPPLVVDQDCCDSLAA